MFLKTIFDFLYRIGICVLDVMEPEVSTPTSLPTSLRFRCSSKLVPGQWHHLAVVMAKDVKKSCLVSVYFNGIAFGTGKVGGTDGRKQ